MIDVLTEQLRAPITEETPELYVGGTVFKTGPPERVGVELEWLVHDADRPADPIRSERLAEVLAETFDPPLAGVLTHRAGWAAGAQLAARPARRLHRRRRRRPRSAPRPDRDRRPDPHRSGSRSQATGPAHRRPALPGDGPALSPAAARRPHDDVLDRVRAGLPGRRRDDAEIADRWHALHAWLPVLTALFANSPTPGRRCTRAAVWGAIDPTRTSAPVGPDPRSAYGRWALDAQLLAVRRRPGPGRRRPG
jgi:glutamate--cysteine ligase